MDSTEADACLQILSAVAAADGSCDSTESAALGLLGRSAPGSAQGVDVEQAARRIRSVAARRATFDAALAIAAIDGRCSAEEHALLTRLCAALELEEPLDLAVSEAKWSARVRPYRSDLADAETDFLHRIASARAKGALTSERYAELVAELRARRDDILREALAPVLSN